MSKTDVVATLVVSANGDGTCGARLDGTIPADLAIPFMLRLDQVEIALMKFSQPFDVNELGERLSEASVPIEYFADRIANG